MDHAVEALRHADMAVNTIPGLAADSIAEALETSNANMGGTLLDVVYDPRPTKLMQAWRQRGGNRHRRRGNAIVPSNGAGLPDDGNLE